MERLKNYVPTLIVLVLFFVGGYEYEKTKTEFKTEHAINDSLREEISQLRTLGHNWRYTGPADEMRIYQSRGMYRLLTPSDTSATLSPYACEAYIVPVDTATVYPYIRKTLTNE